MLANILKGSKTASYDLSFIGSFSNTSDLTTYTFSNVNFGVPSPNREIFVQVIATTSTTRTISSVTIGGVTSTRTINTPSSASSSQTVGFATIPSGTSGNVVITLSGGATACWISVYRVNNRPNIGTTETGYSTVTNTNTTAPINVAANGFLIGNILYTSAPTSVVPDTFIIEGNLIVESVYRGSYRYSRIGLSGVTDITNTNVRTGGSTTNRHTLWAFN
jgi:hypothetical protein